MRNFFIENLQNGVIYFVLFCLCLCLQLWKEYFSNLLGQHVVSLMPVLLHPKSVGELLLRSNNPEDPPLIQPNYLTHAQDVETLYHGNFVWFRESWKCEKHFQIENTPTCPVMISFCPYDLLYFRNWASEEVAENETHAGIGGKVKWHSTTRLQVVTIWF